MNSPLPYPTRQKKKIVTILQIIVICISRPRSRFLTYREKNCRRGRLRPRQNNLEDVQEFRGQAVHNIFCAPEKNK
jgi:hypothetical protein